MSPLPFRFVSREVLFIVIRHIFVAQPTPSPYECRAHRPFGIHETPVRPLRLIVALVGPSLDNSALLKRLLD